MAFFLEPILSTHDRVEFESVCYSDVKQPDAVTGRLRALAGEWRDIRGRSDDQVAELVRRDRIDILVDLAGHTAGNRLLVFARKPAPVQVTYLGYPNTTGLTSIDYRITDECADPTGAADRLHTEKLVRLKNGFLCYLPPEESPEVSPTPVLRNGTVTFGSFNQLPKLSNEVVRIWAATLSRVPGSRLLLKAHGFSNEETRSRFRERFAEHGITPDRLELRCDVPSTRSHLELYGEVDVALDPFPYNGTTTTCEALWMGVPVIAWAGPTHRARVGVSLLTGLGLAEWIAESRERYVELAVELAGDPARLDRIRHGLRDRMRQAPLMDGAGFTRGLEQAYREMWRSWVRGCGDWEARDREVENANKEC